MSTSVQVKRVLVGVDLDDSSAHALATAGAIAETLGATVTLVHAHKLDVPAYFTEGQVGSLESERAAARRACLDDLRTFAARHTALPVEAELQDGPPANAILRLAPAYDLIVVGTRRLHGPRRWWLGSVAEMVLRESPVPVLIVPLPERTAS